MDWNFSLEYFRVFCFRICGLIRGRKIDSYRGDFKWESNHADMLQKGSNAFIWTSKIHSSRLPLQIFHFLIFSAVFYFVVRLYDSAFIWKSIAIPLFIFFIEDVRDILCFLNMTNLSNSIYSKYNLKR